MDRPMAQAFALIGIEGSFCAAARVIEAGIMEADPSRREVVDGWVSLGHCVNRIAGRQTLH